MGTQAVGPAAAFSWLKQAINLGRENPRAIFGSIALLALVATIPSLVQVGLQQGGGMAPEQVLTVAGVVTLAMVVVYPLLIGGVLRVIHASEHGRPTHATALFDTFRAGQGRGRLIGFGAVLVTLYVVAFAVVLAVFGEQFMPWYMELLATSMGPDGGQAAVIGDLPDGFGTVMGLSILLGLFFGGVYAIGFGQVALADRGVGAALRDGAVGTLKNLLPILLLAVVSVVLLFGLFLVVALVGGLLAVIGGLVHPLLAAALVAPVYLGMLLVVYVVMFGVMYYMWRDICIDDRGAAPLHAEGRDQLEL